MLMGLYVKQEHLNNEGAQEEDMNSRARYLTRVTGCIKGPEMSKYTCFKLDS